ncbi:glycosyltransferase family 17 protein [Flammeovirga kamogawensis]|uniref:Glycosyltransferase family 17 n=1 Tax=Flammeovirga kamogawensis TaxID=373891 RepID=A0ABX8GSB1_9BACT|nr:hypothetical protein [Flammeovirga kamogawensis]MBB6462947.1 beta-1,4-mannosyl-glycoprotein beta-1,4-N-acetylglucosaminyltransferase [Flammeovirga kamogawensis]QWG06474.1 hypothetical protein KM029_14190 [Flammeovirga kamogawensis]TRX68303.1 hypothetical protein EO216_09205 [Flammeovirga kamogawensis]
MRKIYDCFMLFNELDLLEIRLKLYYEHVDHFVIVECNQSFVGKTKAFVFEENKNRFKKYIDKIIYIKLENELVSDNFWDNEATHRNAITRGLNDANEDDIIFISDLDEFYDLKLLDREKTFDQVYKIEIPHHNYFINYKTNIIFNLTFVGTLQQIKKTNNTLDEIRKSEDFRHIVYNPKEDKCAHMSYVFGWDIDVYIYKLNSFSHQEYNKKPYTSTKHIKHCLKFPTEIFMRSGTWIEYISPEETMFADLIDEYPHLFQKETNFKPNNFSEWIFYLRRKLYKLTSKFIGKKFQV